MAAWQIGLPFQYLKSGRFKNSVNLFAVHLLKPDFNFNTYAISHSCLQELLPVTKENHPILTPFSPLPTPSGEPEVVNPVYPPNLALPLNPNLFK